MSIQDPEAAATIREAFLGLAATLADCDPTAWDEQSLCEHWLVRNVVAHLTTAARVSSEEFLAELESDGGDFPATIERIADRDGRLDPSTLVSNLRDERLHEWRPPGGGEAGALTHVVIHGLDVTMPLGLPVSCSDAAQRAVLDILTTGGVHEQFGIHLDDVHLTAPDLDWSYGDGRTVVGSAPELILALSGRRLDTGLDGSIARADAT